MAGAVDRPGRFVPQTGQRWLQDGRDVMTGIFQNIMLLVGGGLKAAKVAVEALPRDAESPAP
jgi:hypothetical protein